MIIVQSILCRFITLNWRLNQREFINSWLFIILFLLRLRLAQREILVILGNDINISLDIILISLIFLWLFICIQWWILLISWIIWIEHLLSLISLLFWYLWDFIWFCNVIKLSCVNGCSCLMVTILRT